MTPNFALTLSPDGLSLLHRSPRGWLLVGEVALDRPGLTQRLEDLREKANRLSPGNVTTKLVLPPELLRFVTLSAPAQDPEARRSLIEANLEGLTPYAVQELAFDWVDLGDYVRVAAVARETLQEAESFATEYGFSPIYFTALPEEDGPFEREPYFGLTRRAQTIGGFDEATLRGDDPAYVVGRAAIPEAESHPDDLAAPETETPPEVYVPQPVPEAEADAAAPALIGTPPQAPPAPPEELAERDEAQEADQQTEPAVVAPAEQENPLAPDESTTPAVAGQEGPAAAAPEAEDEVSAKGADERAKEQPVQEDHSPVDDRTPPPPAQNPPSDARRVLAAAANVSASRRGGLNDARFSQDTAVSGNAKDAGAARVAIAASRPEEQSAAEANPDAAHTGADTRRTAASNSEKPSTSTADSPQPPTAPPLHDAEAVTAGGAAAAFRRPMVAMRPDADTEPDLAAESAASMTRGGGSAPSKPRRELGLGLILTGGLLLVMAVVALWAIFAEPSTEGTAEAPPPLGASVDEETVVVVETTPAAPPPETTPLPEEPATRVTDPVDTPDGPETAPAPTVEPLPETAELPATAPPVPANESSPPAEDVADIAQSLRTTAEALVTAANDPAAVQTSPAGTEAEPDLPVGTPAAEPISPALPGGVQVIQGPPPVVPPARPREIPSSPDLPVTGTEDAAAPMEGTATAPVTPLPDGQTIAPADPAQPTLRPRQRPQGAPGAEDASLMTGEEVVASLSLQPRPRPGSIATLMAEIEPDLDAQATALALAASPKPLLRPKAAVVPETVAVAAPPPQAAAPVPPSPPVVSTRAVDAALAAALAGSSNAAPAEVDDEPELTAVVPNIPTTASVAAQATVSRAINLRQDNLIGVYGSSRSRRALVRSSNGRMLQLRVGDRYDGGQVAVIHDRELHYVKNGRTFALGMPQG